MEEHKRDPHRSKQYQYQYHESADSYRKSRQEKVTYVSDTERPGFMNANRSGGLSLSSVYRRVPSPPPLQARPKSTMYRSRQNSSPPPRNTILRSASSGGPGRADQLEAPRGPVRNRLVQVDQYLSPAFPASDHRRPLDDQVPSPTFASAVTGPAIQVISPDGIPPAGERHSGHPWSRNRSASVAIPESSGGPPLSQGASHLGENVYTYTELRPLQFRLVKIFAARMAVIKCTIVHESWVEPPPYIAISYAWGDSDDKREIRIDEAKIPISANLFGALSALREKGGDVYVWADALCINQQNDVEKSEQIKLMALIYKNAKSVAIWLGPEGEGSERALGFLLDLRVRSSSDEEIMSLISSPRRLQDLAAVAALFQRSYWSRIWVVQEVFSASAATVYCGTAKVPWHVFKVASNIFAQYKGELDYQFSPTQLDLRRFPKLHDSRTYPQVLAYEGPNSLPDVRTMRISGEEALLHVLRACRRKLSGEPRDKVFALLGILPEDIRKEFPVQYQDSVKEIFTNVVDFLISTTGSLDVICESIHFPKYVNSANLPSWVPDWSHNPDTVAMCQQYHFAAAGTTSAKWRFIDDRLRNELEVSAIYVDTVQIEGVPVGTLCTSSDYIMAFLHWRALLLQQFGRADSSGPAKDAHEAFCETLCVAQIPKNWNGGLAEWMKACYHVFASLMQDRLPCLPLDSELEAYLKVKTNVGREHRRQFLQDIGKHMMGRCFYITKGRRMGLGSGFMLPGDIIVVPLGCRTPIILREEGNSPRRYRLVGDAYIEGYMHGLALEKYRNGEKSIEKFILV